MSDISSEDFSFELVDSNSVEILTVDSWSQLEDIYNAEQHTDTFNSLFCSEDFPENISEDGSEHSGNYSRRSPGRIRHESIKSTRIELDREVFPTPVVTNLEILNTKSHIVTRLNIEEDLGVGSDSDGEVSQSTEREVIEETAVVRELRRTFKKQRLLHEVLQINPDGSSSQRIRRGLQYSPKSGAGIHLICNHGGDHYHIVHDCRYGENRCRCPRYTAIRSGQRYHRRLTWSQEFTADHWRNLAAYFEKIRYKIKNNLY